MAEWLGEGAAERSAHQMAPILHLLVKGDGDCLMWCSGSPGVERTTYGHSRRCPECRRLAQAAVDEGTLSLADVAGWNISAPAAIWGDRAVNLLNQALSELRDNTDALPTISAAEACLRIQAGELSPAELDGFVFPGEPVPEDCTCPPDLKARGGFRSTCDAHGVWVSA